MDNPDDRTRATIFYAGGAEKIMQDFKIHTHRKQIDESDQATAILGIPNNL